MKPAVKTILFLTIFSMAMGFMESAVVVYLRTLYYPSGFDFPLVPMATTVLFTELLREAATLIMLLSIAIIAGKNFAQQFVFFLFCFAVWDIFYYVFLKLLIDWPPSLLTGDILFLLPVPWAGPVLAPCLLSMTMILMTFMIVYLQQHQFPVSFRRIDWLLMITASLIVIFSFIVDYFGILYNATGTPNSIVLQDTLGKFTPERYNWYIFAVGELIILTDMALMYVRSHQAKNREMQDSLHN